jgi:hypothetical protein
MSRAKRIDRVDNKHGLYTGVKAALAGFNEGRLTADQMTQEVADIVRRSDALAEVESSIVSAKNRVKDVVEKAIFTTFCDKAEFLTKDTGGARGPKPKAIDDKQREDGIALLAAMGVSVDLGA